MWWFGWSASEVDEMTLDELERWVLQAQRQAKAKYSKAAIY